ncbi:MAG: M1 family aminopeptidase, partial [Deltaproteobacteria bacterium]|nr:M1 family aminopeptidase [Deltaproteobacteria bacterium]
MSLTGYGLLTGIDSQICCSAAKDGFALPGAGKSYAPDLALEPTHIDVRLHFDLEACTAEGSVTTTVRGNRDGARSLGLDAVGLEDVTIIGDELGGRYDGEIVHLSWSSPFARGEERKVEVRYRVTNPITGMSFSKPDEAYPHRSLFVATDHETERARYWLPCVDYPAVRTTFDFHLTADAKFTCLANGVLVERTEHSNGTSTHHWRLDQACPSYLSCFAIGDFIQVQSETVDGCPIACYTVDRHAAEDLERSFAATPKMMRWLVERLGHPFPYPKYAQIALPEVGGAMENISLVTWDQMFILDETLAQEWQPLVDSINIHEMAHSYFGDAIVCRHFEHSWLKESWAVYIENVYLEETATPEDRDFDMVLNAEGYFAESDDEDARPIVTREYSSSWDLFDKHLYPGGAWRIHMLRHIVGDGAFWSAVRDYVGSFMGKVVETDDFRRKLEEHSALNLTRFFDQWLYSPGYPKLKGTFKHDGERNEVVLTVEQTQVDEKKNIGLFSFLLEVAIEDADGTRVVTVDMKEKRHVLVVPVSGEPKQVCFDPDQKVLFGLELNPGSDLLGNTLTGGKRVHQRLWAARELIRSGTATDLKRVRDAMAVEAFWGVRALVAKALGDSGAGGAIPILTEMLLAEENPLAKSTMARACGALRDERLGGALREFLAAEQPYHARAAALESLGAQRDDAHLELLVAASRDDGLHSIVRAGALRGLGAIRSREAFDLLSSRVAYGVEPEMARAAAVDALGRSAVLQDRIQRESAVETLADLTR